MLARNRFDPESLVRVVNAVQLRGGGFQPLQPLGETDIEVGGSVGELLKPNRDMMVDTTYRTWYHMLCSLVLPTCRCAVCFPSFLLRSAGISGASPRHDRTDGRG